MTVAPRWLSNIPRLLAAFLLAAAAGCSVSESGKIKCVDDAACPHDYPLCSGGVCVEGSPSLGDASVSFVGVTGKQATDPLRETVIVQVTARAATGVKSLGVTASDQTFSPAP